MKESEIRPKNIFDELLRLAKLDTETYFANSNRSKIMCPACGKLGKHSFQKKNLQDTIAKSGLSSHMMIVCQK